MDLAGPSLPLALVLGGLLLIAAEFVLPGAVIGAVGALLGLAGLALAASHGLGEFLLLAAVFVGGVAAEFVLFRRLMPGLARQAGLASPAVDTGSAVPGAAAHAALVGREGVALTALAPTGNVEVAGRRVEATSADGFLDRGAAVVVTEATAHGVVVRRR